MRDRLLLLLLFGISVIKIYEEYDEEEQDENNAPDVIKHKHSRRDADGLADRPLPSPIAEDVVEAVHLSSSPRLFTQCKQVGDECSCRYLLCFGPASCDEQISVSFNETSLLDFKKSQQNHIWIKKCRQTTLLGQNLCECRRYLYDNDGNKASDESAHEVASALLSAASSF